MEVEGFLIGSGYALLLVLLGWASQITSKNKETKELEVDFLKKTKLKRSNYNKMINEGGTTEDSFSAAVDFLFSTENENVEIFENIKRVKEDIKKLDKKYSWRFFVLIFMSITLFICGLIGLLLPTQYKIWTLIPFLIFVIVLFRNLFEVHNLESKYTENISKAMEKL